jgi:hypothetical protein
VLHVLARGVLVVCVALLWVDRAHAVDLHRPGLNWVRLTGAEACLASAQLAERVEARVGRVLFVTPDDAEVFVDGFVRKAAAQGWDVTLDVSDPDGHVLGKREMHFDGGDCAVIDEGVALVIAVTLYPNTGLTEGGVPLDAGIAGGLDSLFSGEPVDPDPAALLAGEGAQVDTGAAAATTSPQPARASAAATAPNAAPHAHGARWSVAVDATPTIGFGQLPDANLGLAAHVQIVPPGIWPIELGATTLLERTVQASAGVAGEASFKLALASLTVCPWQPAWLPALAFCAGAELGRLHVAPNGFAESQPTSNDLVANLLAAGVLRAPIAGGLYLRAALLLALPLVQRGYGYQTPDAASQQLYRMPQVAGRAEIGLGWRF